MLNPPTAAAVHDAVKADAYMAHLNSAVPRGAGSRTLGYAFVTAGAISRAD
jgi:hypothetical protein